jgi:hypothetical protein
MLEHNLDELGGESRIRVERSREDARQFGLKARLSQSTQDRVLRP